MAQDVAHLAERFQVMRTAEALLRDATRTCDVAARLSYSTSVLSKWKADGYLDPTAFPAHRRPRPAAGLLVAMRCQGLTPLDLELRLGMPWPALRAARYRPTRLSNLERLAGALNVPLGVVTGEEAPSAALAHPPGVTTYPHGITEIRQTVLRYIWTRFQAAGVAGLPSVPDVAAAIGRSSRSAHLHLVKLLESGYLATRGRGYLDQYLLSQRGVALTRRLVDDHA